MLIIATQNQGKFREILPFFSDLPLELKSLADYPDMGPITEDGKTFLENASKKARVVWEVTKGFVLADDSGIVCDDLGGRPGIHSARYAGPEATDEENNKKLIEEIQAIHDPSRMARYVCAMVLINPEGRGFKVEETCEGMITFSPSGSGGFGYDPFFYLPDKKRTMAEISLEEKNKISHRGKALKKVHDYLKKLIQSGPL